MPTSTYILAISWGTDDEPVAMGVAAVKEADINYSFLGGWGGEEMASYR